MSEAASRSSSKTAAAVADGVLPRLHDSTNDLTAYSYRILDQCVTLCDAVDEIRRMVISVPPFQETDAEETLKYIEWTEQFEAWRSDVSCIGCQLIQLTAKIRLSPVVGGRGAGGEPASGDDATAGQTSTSNGRPDRDRQQIFEMPTAVLRRNRSSTLYGDTSAGSVGSRTGTGPGGRKFGSAAGGGGSMVSSGTGAGMLSLSSRRQTIKSHRTSAAKVSASADRVETVEVDINRSSEMDKKTQSRDSLSGTDVKPSKKHPASEETSKQHQQPQDQSSVDSFDLSSAATIPVPPTTGSKGRNRAPRKSAAPSLSKAPTCVEGKLAEAFDRYKDLLKMSDKGSSDPAHDFDLLPHVSSDDALAEELEQLERASASGQLCLPDVGGGSGGGGSIGGGSGATRLYKSCLQNLLGSTGNK